MKIGIFLIVLAFVLTGCVTPQMQAKDMVEVLIEAGCKVKVVSVGKTRYKVSVDCPEQ